MKKKLTFIFEYKYNKTYHSKYEIEYLKKFYEITIFDLSNIFSTHLKKKTKRKTRGAKIFIIKKIFDFENQLRKNSPDYTILNGVKSFNFKISKILRKLTKTSIVELYNSELPIYIPKLRNISIKKIIMSKYFFIFFPHIILSIFRRIISYPSKARKQDYIVDYLFYAGSETLNTLKLPSKNYIKKISSPALDYNLHLREDNKKRIIKKKYVVFLDSMLFHHDDQNIKFFKRDVSLKYFEEINKFFYILEKKLNLKVIIAMHPSCNIKNYSKFFENRTCLKNQSINLVKYSELVLLHPSSTSINFPVIYNKPMLFLTTEELNKSFRHYVAHQIQKMIFRQNILNISSVSENIIFPKFKIDKKAFKWYYKGLINSSKISNKSLNNFIEEELK